MRQREKKRRRREAEQRYSLLSDADRKMHESAVMYLDGANPRGGQWCPEHAKDRRWPNDGRYWYSDDGDCRPIRCKTCRKILAYAQPDLP